LQENPQFIYISAPLTLQKPPSPPGESGLLFFNSKNLG